MSKLDETWTSIQEYLQLYKDLDSLTLNERREKAMKIVMGIPKLQKDIDYFLEQAPPNDLRRDVCLDLKELMAKGKSL
jgi:hypothetical protein